MSEARRGTDTVTQLLVSKDAPYAEIEENVRIALSVLRDSGWRVDRIEGQLQLQCNFTAKATPVDQIGRIEQLVAANEAAELRFAALRTEVTAGRTKLHIEAWRMAAGAVALGGIAMKYFGPGWTLGLALVAAAVSFAIRIAARLKEAKC
jgi:hypothetical protein